MEAQHLRNGLFLMMVLQINFGILLKKVKKFLQKHGKVGSIGLFIQTTYDDEDKAYAALNKLIQSKIKKGYRKIN